MVCRDAISWRMSVQKNILARLGDTGMYIITELERFEEHGLSVDTESAVDIESLISKFASGSTQSCIGSHR